MPRFIPVPISPFVKNRPFGHEHAECAFHVLDGAIIHMFVEFHFSSTPVHPPEFQITGLFCRTRIPGRHYPRTWLSCVTVTSPTSCRAS